MSIADLAARLKCSKRSIYELAPSKKELVLLVLGRRLGKVREDGWHAASKQASMPERIRAYLAAGVAGSQDMSTKYSEDIESDPDTARLFDEHQRRRTDGLRALIQEGVRDGHFKGFHPYLVAEVMMAAVQRLRQPSFLIEGNISLAAAFEELSRLIQHGILANDRRNAAEPAGRSKGA